MSWDRSRTPEVRDSEVVPIGQRRRFSAAYKLRIVEEADACSEAGEIGALLRREGLYTSHLSKWRKARACGQLAGLKPKKRGREGTADADLRDEVERLRRDKDRLEARLAQAETIIEVQKKLSQLLGVTPEEDEGR
jgi:transposase